MALHVYKNNKYIMTLQYFIHITKREKRGSACKIWFHLFKDKNRPIWCILVYIVVVEHVRFVCLSVFVGQLSERGSGNGPAVSQNERITSRERLAQGWEGEFLEKASIITFSLLHPDTCTVSTNSQSMQSHHNKPQPHTHTLTN